jgi:hypothetical protein
MLPQIGKQAIGAGLIKPVDVLIAAQKDAAQDQAQYPFGMRFGVSQRQGRAPGAAEDHPAVDAEPFAQFLDIGHQMPGRVVAQFRVRGGLAAAALVEQHDAIAFRVEEPPVHRLRNRRPVHRAGIAPANLAGCRIPRRAGYAGHPRRGAGWRTA